MTDAAAAAATVTPERTGVIQWESLPRRMVTLYLPLACFVVVLLFPFYWMTITAFKSNEELYDYKDYNPFWVSLADARQHQQAAVRDRLSALADGAR